MYINNHQVYNPSGLYAFRFYTSNNLKGAISEHKKIFHCEAFDYEEFPDEFIEAPFSESFCTRGMKKFSISDGFMLYGKLRVDFFSTTALQYQI